MTLHEIRAAMEPIVRRAGAYVKSAVPVHANEKSGHADLVTEYDVNTQRMLVRELTALLPEANVMGEEEHLSCDVTKGYCFIIDPIDGTTNFVMGFNHSAVSVALLLDGEPVIGMIYNPWAEEFYSAVRGEGAFCNDTPISVRNAPLRECAVTFGTAAYYPPLAHRTARVVDRLITEVVAIRSLGSGALDVCDSARGRCGVYFEFRLCPWDYAAGSLIVTEAGGQITDEHGNPISYTTPGSIVSGGKQACRELIDLLRQIP